MQNKSWPKARLSQLSLEHQLPVGLNLITFTQLERADCFLATGLVITPGPFPNGPTA